jgi:hypothetical protein
MQATPQQCKEAVFHLSAIVETHGEALPGWVERTYYTVCDLEESGRTEFGGPHVLAYYLRLRARGCSWLALNSYLSQLVAERK